MIWLVVVANIVLITLAVVTHYEALRFTSDWIERQTLPKRFHLLLAVFAALIAHAIEVWLFAIGIYILLAVPDLGALTGLTDQGFLDCVYFSLSNYTSLGMGDIQPLGLVRFIAGFEALAGLVLITWTASFLYFQMQRTWRHPD